jgi:predicted nucleic acid-binding protein
MKNGQKIIGANDLFAYLRRRVIINDPLEGEISRCVPFFKEANLADMIHAATCLASEAILITNDRHFDRIKRVGLIEVWSIADAISLLSPPINPP